MRNYFFFVFFLGIENIFFCFDKSQFFQILMTSWNLLTQKLKTSFFEWSTLGNVACRRWLFQLEASFLIWESFWKGWLLVRGCSHHSCLEKKYGLKVFPRNGQFLVNVPWGINQGNFRASWSWDLCFWSLKRFGRFEAVESLDAYQITNYQFSFKNS